MLKVRTLQKGDLENLVSYSHKMYPDRNLCFKDYINFWLSQSADEINNCVVLVDEDNQIHGEVMSSSMKYYYNGEERESVWGFDLIVDEELRKDGWGVDVLMYREGLFPTSFASGVAPLALKIELKQGNTYLGFMQKYLRVVNPFWLINALKGIIPLAKYPENVRVGESSFKLLSKEQLPSLDTPYNKTLWEPARQLEFIKWRFFGGLHDYAFYKDVDSNDYFVIRTIKYKHLTMALLVDFRCDVSQCDSINRIFIAAEQVVKRIHIPFLITGSSLATVDQIVRQRKYVKIGHEGHILGFIDVKNKKEDITSRNFAFVTMADSDCETDL